MNLTNKVHFELNVGYGLCNYERLIKSPKYNYYYYEDYKESLLQVQAGLSFRNKKYNFGLMYNHLNLFSVHPQNKADFLNLKFGLNLMSSKKNWYLGPYGLYGHSLNSKPLNGAFEYIEIGLESYVKNIHLSIGYQIYQDYSWEENKTAHMHSLHLTLGYAIPFGKTAEEIIVDAVKEYSYPVCFDFPAGHIDRNLALILGRKVKLEVEAKTTLFLESV